MKGVPVLPLEIWLTIHHVYIHNWSFSMAANWGHYSIHVVSHLSFPLVLLHWLLPSQLCSIRHRQRHSAVRLTRMPCWNWRQSSMLSSWNGITKLCHGPGLVIVCSLLGITASYPLPLATRHSWQASTLEKKCCNVESCNCQPHIPVVISSLLKQSTPGWDLSWPEELQQTCEHQAWHEPAHGRNTQ